MISNTQSNNVEIVCLPLGPLQTNCYIVYPKGGTVALVIDPAASPDIIRQELSKLGLTMGAVVMTHGHFDHINAAASLAEDGAPLLVHEADAVMLSRPEKSGAAHFGFRQEVCEPTQLMKDGDIIDLWEGKLSFRILHTPGHSPGSMCLISDPAGVVFVGDLLFAGGIGRSDILGGDEMTIEASLHKIMQLPDTTIVYPGHGPATTIGEERKSNPFIP